MVSTSGASPPTTISSVIFPQLEPQVHDDVLPHGEGDAAA